MNSRWMEGVGWRTKGKRLFLVAHHNSADMTGKNLLIPFDIMGGPKI